MKILERKDLRHIVGGRMPLDDASCTITATNGNTTGSCSGTLGCQKKVCNLEGGQPSSFVLAVRCWDVGQTTDQAAVSSITQGDCQYGFTWVNN